MENVPFDWMLLIKPVGAVLFGIFGVIWIILSRNDKK